MSTKAIMPMSDYVAACDMIAEKTGSDDNNITSGELADKIAEVYEAGAAQAEQGNEYNIYQNEDLPEWLRNDELGGVSQIVVGDLKDSNGDFITGVSSGADPRLKNAMFTIIGIAEGTTTPMDYMSINRNGTVIFRRRIHTDEHILVGKYLSIGSNGYLQIGSTQLTEADLIALKNLLK